MVGHLDIRLQKGRAWISARGGQVYIQLGEGEGRLQKHSSIPVSRDHPVTVTLGPKGQATCQSVEGTTLYIEGQGPNDSNVKKHTVEPGHSMGIHEGRWTIKAPSRH